MSKFDPKKTVLLLFDLDVGFLKRLPPNTSDIVVDNASSAIAIARKQGAQVAYIRAALDEDEVQAILDYSPSLAFTKASKEMSAGMHLDAPDTQIHPKLSPKEGDLVHRKIRFGAFMRGPSNVILDEFAAKGINIVILGGVITSGACTECGETACRFGLSACCA